MQRKTKLAGRLTLFAGVTAGAIMLGGCSAGDEGPEPSAGREQSASIEKAEDQPVQEDPEEERDQTESPNYADRFEERDQFIKAQQQPLGSDTLEAVTPEQKELIRALQTYYENRGQPWSSADETFALMLTLNACEQAILDGHEVTDESLISHFATSPVLTEEAAEISGNSHEEYVQFGAFLGVSGMEFICPADFPNWQKAYDTHYGN